METKVRPPALDVVELVEVVEVVEAVEVRAMPPRKKFSVTACLGAAGVPAAGENDQTAAEAGDGQDATAPLQGAPPPPPDAPAKATVQRKRAPRQPRKRKTAEEKAQEAADAYPKPCHRPKHGTCYPFQHLLNFLCISHSHSHRHVPDVKFFPFSHGRGGAAHA